MMFPVPFDDDGEPRTGLSGATMERGRGGFFRGWSSRCCWASVGRGFLVRVGPPPLTVWLRPSFWVWTLSEIVSSTGLGFRACAMARGPAWAGKKGAATLASTMLDRTDTGKVFSFIFSFLAGSDTPKMMRWTLLYSLRQVLKALEVGFPAKSRRYVWNNQKVCDSSAQRGTARHGMGVL